MAKDTKNSPSDMSSDKQKAAKILGALGGKANITKHGKERMAEIGRLGGWRGKGGSKKKKVVG